MNPTPVYDKDITTFVSGDMIDRIVEQNFPQFYKLTKIRFYVQKLIDPQDPVDADFYYYNATGDLISFLHIPARNGWTEYTFETPVITDRWFIPTQFTPFETNEKVVTEMEAYGIPN